jgi:hypothetical protein
MSADLYTVQVFFEGERGCVKAPGVYRAISAPPTIPGLPKLQANDFAGEVNCAYLLPWMGERREMREAESLAVVAWLRAVQKGAA